MNPADYISLLDSSRESALNIWGFMLTVSLGIIAYLASLKEIKKLQSILLIVLFSFFCISNHIALKHNLQTREKLIAAYKSEISYKTDSKLNTVVESFEVNICNNLSAQVLFSISIAATILVITLSEIKQPEKPR